MLTIRWDVLMCENPAVNRVHTLPSHSPCQDTVKFSIMLFKAVESPRCWRLVIAEFQAKNTMKLEPMILYMMVLGDMRLVLEDEDLLLLLPPGP